MSEKPKKIKNLRQLHEWNLNPTLESPIVLEWFLPWFFDDLLMGGKLDVATDAYYSLVDFIIRSENLTAGESIDVVNGKLRSYSVYSTMWATKLQPFFMVASQPNKSKTKYYNHPEDVVFVSPIIRLMAKIFGPKYFVVRCKTCGRIPDEIYGDYCEEHKLK